MNVVWKNTEVVRRLKITVPIIQGPFGGGASSVDLVTAVSESGGLGSYGANHLQASQIKKVAKEIRTRTKQPFAINLWVPHEESEDPPISDEEFAHNVELLKPYFDELGVTLPARPERFWPRYSEQIEALFEARPPVFSFVYGVPSVDIICRCKELEIVTIGGATSPEEAIALDQAGVDLIVASGFEAGGHRVSFLKSPEDSLIGTFALVPQVVDAVKAPVIAAGGIADGRGIAAALALGAEGVQIGTAFLACEESAANPLHRQALWSPKAKSTCLTRAFSGRLARGIQNRFMIELKKYEMNLPRYPIQNWFSGKLKDAAITQGKSDLISLWSGQAAALLNQNHARLLMKSLIEETTTVIKKLKKN